MEIDRVEQREPGARQTSLLTFVVRWFVVGTVGGADLKSVLYILILRRFSGR